MEMEMENLEGDLDDFAGRPLTACTYTLAAAEFLSRNSALLSFDPISETLGVKRSLKHAILFTHATAR
jgi:hypothetical protein